MATAWTRRSFLLSPSLAALSTLPLTAAPVWVEPFDGVSLNGWTVTGHAAWTVENRTLVGRQGPNGAAGDLFSVRHWVDFELVCEWQMRFPGNSGIWFRVSGPRTGYQVDFLDEPAYPDVLSGSVYCMGKRFIAENRDPLSVHRDGWNRLRLRAQGPKITVIQNGRQVVAVTDDRYPGPGSIGVQVHAGETFAGMEVRVRNLRVRPIPAAIRTKENPLS